MPHLNLHCIDPLYPMLTLQVSDNQEQKSIQITALIDTGFDSYLMIPAKIAKELNLEIIKETNIELATGYQEVCQLAAGKVFLPDFWDGCFELEIILTDDDNECLVCGKMLQAMCKVFAIDYSRSQLQFKSIKTK